MLFPHTHFNYDITGLRMKSARIIRSVIILFMLIFPAIVQSQEWDLRKNDNDILVYTRDYTGSSFKEIRAVLFVKSTLAGVTKFFDDVSLFPQWIYACKTATLLKKISDNEGYIYSEIEATWPVSNRDVITHYIRIQDTATKVIQITLNGIKDYVPEMDGIVRVESLSGTTRIIPLKNGIVQIIHQLHVEPGGYVPAWLANFFVTDGPLYSFQKLKQFLALDYYCTYKSDDILEP